MFLSSPRVDSIFSRENWFSPSEDLSLATQEFSSVTVLSSRVHSLRRTSTFFTHSSLTALTLLYLSLRPATSPWTTSFSSARTTSPWMESFWNGGTPSWRTELSTPAIVLLSQNRQELLEAKRSTPSTVSRTRLWSILLFLE